ncbi:unnamed protein product [Callosobruchus maculatus]|uniref:Uncharacterized protein n=1 Tax=Callosobruchus maculatus TaxID=64391 RepID=A0A653CEZ9_CALMS|nr:unnamed protein product [Callosobruchus maculatus]
MHRRSSAAGELLNPEDRLVFPNYDVIRADRLTGRGGGLAVLVKRIDYHRSSNAEMQSIEAASVVINMAGGIPLKITSFGVMPPEFAIPEDSEISCFEFSKVS